MAGRDDRQDERGRTDYRGGSSGAHGEPQTKLKHPEEYAEDLNPNHMDGQNVGQPSSQREQGMRNARDHKDVHRSLAGAFSDDELRQIPILDAGQRLQQGATYMNLRDPERREFTATGEMQAGQSETIVPKDQVAYSIWNRLRGIDDPERAPSRPQNEED